MQRIRGSSDSFIFVSSQFISLQRGFEFQVTISDAGVTMTDLLNSAPLAEMVEESVSKLIEYHVGHADSLWL